MKLFKKIMSTIALMGITTIILIVSILLTYSHYPEYYKENSKEIGAFVLLFESFILIAIFNIWENR